MHRVVVTGLGIVSCLGNTLGDVTDALRRGRSGIELLPERKALGFRSSLGGKLKAFDLSGVPKKHLRQLGPGSQIAVHATHQALRDAAWEPHHIKDERTAVVIGSGGNFHDIYQQCHMFRDDGLKLGGTALQRVMHDTVSANLSVLLAAHGPDYELKALQSERALTDEERAELVIAAHVGTVGQFDWQKLAGWDVDTMRAWGMDDEALQGWNSDAANLATMLTADQNGDADAEPQIDRAAELNEKWQVRTGDLFGLGKITKCPKCGKIHSMDGMK